MWHKRGRGCDLLQRTGCMCDTPFKWYPLGLWSRLHARVELFIANDIARHVIMLACAVNFTASMSLRMMRPVVHFLRDWHSSNVLA